MTRHDFLFVFMPQLCPALCNAAASGLRSPATPPASPSPWVSSRSWCCSPLSVPATPWSWWQSGAASWSPSPACSASPPPLCPSPLSASPRWASPRAPGLSTPASPLSHLYPASTSPGTSSPPSCSVPASVSASITSLDLALSRGQSLTRPRLTLATRLASSWLLTRRRWRAQIWRLLTLTTPASPVCQALRLVFKQMKSRTSEVQSFVSQFCAWASSYPGMKCHSTCHHPRF